MLTGQELFDAVTSRQKSVTGSCWTLYVQSSRKFHVVCLLCKNPEDDIICSLSCFNPIIMVVLYQEDKSKMSLTIVGVGKRLGKPNPLGFAPEVVDLRVCESDPEPSQDGAAVLRPIKTEKEETPRVKPVITPQQEEEEDHKPTKPSPTKRTVTRRIKMDDE